MIFKVFVHPNSKKPRVDKDLLGSMHVYVNQPPLDGKANKAVLEALAKHFRVSKSKVSLLRGDKSKIKVFSIET